MHQKFFFFLKISPLHHSSSRVKIYQLYIEILRLLPARTSGNTSDSALISRFHVMTLPPPQLTHDGVADHKLFISYHRLSSPNQVYLSFLHNPFRRFRVTSFFYTVTSKTCADVEKNLSFTNEKLMLFIHSLINLIKNNPATQLGWLLSVLLSDRFELSSSVHDNDDAPESGSTQVLW